MRNTGKEVKSLAQDYTAGKWWSQDLDSGSLVPEPAVEALAGPVCASFPSQNDHLGGRGPGGGLEHRAVEEGAAASIPEKTGGA